jgi:hypothetical protein
MVSMVNFSAMNSLNQLNTGTGSRSGENGDWLVFQTGDWHLFQKGDWLVFQTGDWLVFQKGDWLVFQKGAWPLSGKGACPQCHDAQEKVPVPLSVLPGTGTISKRAAALY